MAREHRRTVVTEVPPLTRRAFTMRELARLAARQSEADLRAALAADEQGTDGARLATLLQLLASTRGATPPATDASDDVVDPMGRQPAVFELAARQIDDASGQVERVLRTALSR
jgi:protein-tyrosine phosphatase